MAIGLGRIFRDMAEGVIEGMGRGGERGRMLFMANKY